MKPSLPQASQSDRMPSALGLPDRHVPVCDASQSSTDGSAQMMSVSTSENHDTFQMSDDEMLLLIWEKIREVNSDYGKLRKETDKIAKEVKSQGQQVRQLSRTVENLSRTVETLEKRTSMLRTGL